MPSRQAAYKNLSPAALAQCLSAIHHSAFERGTHRGVKQGGWSADDFKILLAKPTSFIIGTRHSFVLWQSVPPEAEILTLCVHRSYQRQGLARALLVQAVSAWREAGITHVHLEVASDNLAARTLYAEIGFNACGKRAHYYRGSTNSPANSPANPQDACLMRLDL